MWNNHWTLKQRAVATDLRQRVLQAVQDGSEIVMVEPGELATLLELDVPVEGEGGTANIDRVQIEQAFIELASDRPTEEYHST